MNPPRQEGRVIIKGDFSILFGLYKKNHELLENALLMCCNKGSFLFSFLFSNNDLLYINCGMKHRR